MEFVYIVYIVLDASEGCQETEYTTLRDSLTGEVK